MTIQSVLANIDWVVPSNTAGLVSFLGAEQQQINQHITSLYSTRAASYLDQVSNSTNSLKIAEIPRALKAVGFQGQFENPPGTITYGPFVAFDLSRFPDLTFINNKGTLVVGDARLTIIHEILHLVFGSVDPNPMSDADMNSASFNPTGQVLDKQNEIAADLGLGGQKQIAYLGGIIFGVGDSREAYLVRGQNYSHSLDIDNTRFGDWQPRGGAQITANEINTTALASSRDLLFGFSGNDTISAGDGADHLYGGSGGDSMNGGGGDDYLIGGAENDTISGADNDTMDGGEGNDVANYDDPKWVLTPIAIEYDGTGAAPVVEVTDQSGGTDRLTNFETILGTRADDTFIYEGAIPTDFNLTIDANKGQDGKNDLIDLQGSNSGMRVSLVDGNGYIQDRDTLGRIDLTGFDSDFFNVQVLGSSLEDILNATGSGVKQIFGGFGDDQISVRFTSGGGALASQGGPDGSAVLSGEEGDDSIVGGDSSDHISGGAGLNVVQGNAGGDWFYFDKGTDPATLNTVLDFDANDRIVWNGYLLEGGLRTLIEGETPTWEFEHYTQFLYEDIAYLGKYGEIYRYSGTSVSIETPDGADIQVYGFANGEGGINLDLRRSTGGHESGWFWSNIVNNGSVDYHNLSGRAQALANPGIYALPTHQGSDGDDQMSGSGGGDNMSGAGGGDGMSGGAGIDVLNGGDGSDTLSGGADADYLYGGAGADTYAMSSADGEETIAEDASSSVDRIEFADLASTDVIATIVGDDLVLANAAATIKVTVESYQRVNGGVEFVTFSDALTWSATLAHANATIIGTAGADYLTGTSFGDLFAGGVGNDTLVGAGGYDRYVYSGESAFGDDTITEAFSTSDVDRLVLGGGLTPSAVQVVRDGPTSGLVTLTFAGFGSIKLTGQFGGSASLGEGVEEIEFAGGATWYKADLQTEYIRQAQTTGNDTITGVAGETRFEFATLAGDDVISDSYSSAPDVFDRLVLGAGLTSDIVTLSRPNSADIKLGFAGVSGSIKIAGEFGSLESSGYGIEIIEFADGVTWDRDQIRSNYGATAGTAGNDSILGFSDFNNTLHGAGGADTITGATLADTLDGGADNDTLIGLAGGDHLVGGDGVDTASYAGSAAVSVSLSTGVAGSGGDAAGDTLDGVENLLGSSQADSLTGGDNANLLDGGSGADTLVGGEGNDTLNGGTGADVLAGGSGDDVYIVDSATDTVAEADLAGTDEVRTDLSYQLGDHVERLISTATSARSLAGNGLDNTIVGGSGGDTIDGAGGNDSLAGGLGSDIYYVDSALDVVTEASSAGTDEVHTTVAAYTLGANIEKLTGDGDVDQELVGNDLNNVISGGLGDDTLIGGLGTDTLAGGAGVDMVDYSDAAGPISVNASSASGSGWSDSLSGIEAIIASDYADTLTGSSSDNRLVGRAGNDSIRGEGGNDTLEGGDGTDSLVGGTGDDVYIIEDTGNVLTEAASGGVDEVRTTLASFSLAAVAEIERLTGTGLTAQSLTGNGLANTITGGGANDTLTGGGGADNLIGGGGDNTASYSTSLVGVTVDLTLITAQVGLGDAQGDVFSGIRHVTGSSLADDLKGNAQGNLLRGGSGNDTLLGGNGADTLEGGDGNDLYRLDDQDVIASDSEGIDEVRTAGSSYTLHADVEVLTGTSNSGQALTGNGRANTLSGGTGADQFNGQGGNDVYIVGAGDTVDEAADSGTDEVRTGAATYQLGANLEILTGTAIGAQQLTGNGLANTLTGAAGTDWIGGGDGADSLIGGIGDDTLAGGAGADSITGGDDMDTVTYAGSSVGVTVVLGGWGVPTGPQVGGDAEGDRLSEIEHVTGSDGSDSLQGSSGTNVLKGGAGNDTLIGGDGTDALSGGAGDDLYVLEGGDTITELAGEGRDEVRTSGSAYQLADNFEILKGTSGGSQTLTGNAADNTISGAGGSDQLIGGGGNDVYVVGSSDVVTEAVDAGIDEVRTALANYTLAADVERIVGTAFVGQALTGNGLNNTITGGAQNDTLVGGAGGDILVGGMGVDLVSYAASGAGVTINLNLADTQSGGGDAQGDTLTGIESLIGSNYADTLIGDNVANYLDGGLGNDTIVGGSANDTLVGGAGVNSLTGSNGTDTASYALASGPVTINIKDSVVNWGASAENVDTLSQIESAIGSAYDDVITGSNNATNGNVLVGGLGRDTIDGLAGNDTLDGGADRDTLIGGTGSDSLTGGASQDTFAFKVTDAASIDVITDLSDAFDTIDLSAIDANALTEGTNEAFSAPLSAFTGQAGELVLTYDSGTGKTLLKGDCNGDAVADFTVELNGDHSSFSAFFY